MTSSSKTVYKRVIIIDDSEVIRTRLFYEFSDIHGLEIIGQAENASDGYKLFTTLNPEIVILDIRMPDDSGINILEKIKQKSPHTIVVMLTNYPYSAYRKRCNELGADYFFDKSTEFDKVKSVIESNNKWNELPESCAESGTKDRSEEILLVEDDQLVREYVHNQLLAAGYRVLLAENGSQALSVLREHENIDLLFTDVVMPGGMSGCDLAEHARKLHPGLKVLFTSGYSENVIMHHGKPDPDVKLLSKPYSQTSLMHNVREALDQK